MFRKQSKGLAPSVLGLIYGVIASKFLIHDQRGMMCPADPF